MKSLDIKIWGVPVPLVPPPGSAPGDGVLPPVHSGNLLLRWNSVYILLHIVEIQFTFKKAWNLLTKFCYSDHMFSRNIFTPLYLKSEISAHAQLAITFLNVLLANILTCYQLETYIGIPFDKWGHRMMSLMWSRDFPGIFYNVCNFFVEMLKFKQSIKLTFEHNKFSKRTVQN